MSKSDDWRQRSLAAVWHPCTQMKQSAADDHPLHLPLIAIARGQGAWLYDFDGQCYLDGISSWWVNLFGHCHPRINAALREQLETLEHVILAGCTHAPVVELSERLTALTEGTLGHCFYASDGASAVEIALKMSFHSWRNRGDVQKQHFLCLDGGYHGETLGALAVTDVALFKDAYAPLIRQAATVPSPDARQAREGETAQDVARRAVPSGHRMRRQIDGRGGRVRPRMQSTQVEPRPAAVAQQGAALITQTNVLKVIDRVDIGRGAEVVRRLAAGQGSRP